MSSNRPPTVDVLVPLGVDRAYSYQVPEDMECQRGDVVEVPVGPRTYLGIVWGFSEPDFDYEKLKKIQEKVGTIPLPGQLLDFAAWVADYTLTPLGNMARNLVKNQESLEDEPPIIGYRLTDDRPERMTAARSRIIDVGRDGLAYTKQHLAEMAGSSPSVVKGLIDQGIFAPVALAQTPVVEIPDPDFDLVSLNEDQTRALASLRTQGKTDLKPVLLEGVTGSGKTEVYFEYLADFLREDRQGLILLPEIALTNQFLERFRRRFGVDPARWHSDLTPKQRNRIWRGVHRGDVQVVVGARSALFLPFSNLGLVIVDEEHDQAYKQEERMTYHGRDMAVVLAHLHKGRALLASATPSVESWVNAHQDKFHYVALKNRYGSGELPNIGIVDLRATPPEKGRWIAQPIFEAVKETIDAGQQALLFLNRRGYAPLTLCRSCGHRFQCNNCTAWLVDHRFRKVLMCHHCGHEERRPDICPSCQSEESLVAVGPGVERIAEDVRTEFPDARMTILSSDMLGGWGALQRQLEAIANHQFDIIIGTQLIAKGHNFPNLMLSAIIDADIGLAQGDLRGAERSWQLLQQVIGRAGRFAPGAKALIQTHMPDHPVLNALKTADSDAFYNAEWDGREPVSMPPFGRLIAIIVSGKDMGAVMRHAKDLAFCAPRHDAITVLGPADPVFTQLRGRFRQRLLVKGPKSSLSQKYVRHWLKNAPKLTGSLKITVDVDPQSFF